MPGDLQCVITFDTLHQFSQSATTQNIGQNNGMIMRPNTNYCKKLHGPLGPFAISMTPVNASGSVFVLNFHCPNVKFPHSTQMRLFAFNCLRTQNKVTTTTPEQLNFPRILTLLLIDHFIVSYCVNDVKRKCLLICFN